MSEQNKKSLKLRYILTDLVEAARQSPGVPRSVRLKNGLAIQVTFNKKNFQLILRRGKVIPSDMEWSTVIKNWPYMTQANYHRQESSAGVILSGFVAERSALQYAFPLPTDEDDEA
jgi:hypothetical protein